MTKKLPGFYSGCQFGTVCNQSIPYNNGTTPPTPPPVRSTNATLLKQCAAIHQRGIEFAANYTELLVALHNVFNGDPDSLYATVGQMYGVTMTATHPSSCVLPCEDTLDTSTTVVHVVAYTGCIVGSRVHEVDGMRVDGHAC